MEDNTKTIQKILLDSIMTVVREEIQKGRSADVVYATITGVDELGSFYRFTYNGHEYIGHSNLPNFSVGENVYVLFNGSQDENVILCGENVSDGSFNANKYVTRVLTQYIISDNSTAVPSDDNANWKTGYEAQDSDKGRWVRTVTNYSDGSVEYSTPVYMTSGSNETAQDLSDFKQQYEKDKEALQGKVDSKINVYYSSEAPVGLKSDNVGDIWVDADNGKSQMWDGSKWVEFTTKVPPELLDQVDGKSTIYTTQPTAPYDKNDVWFNGNDIYVCTTTKTEGEFDSADWARKETYAHQSTVDANNEAFQNFKNVTYSKDISDLRQKVTAQEQELTGNVDGTFISSLKTTVSEHEQKFDEIGNTISEKVNSMFTEKDGTTLSTFVDKVNAIKQTADGTQENYTKIQNTLNDNYFTKEESKNLITKTADGIKVEVDKNTEKIGYSVADVKTYYLQNDGTKPSVDDSAWSLTAPERVAGQHIWTHTIVTLNSGTQVDKGIVDITGADGVAPTVSAERTGSGVEITITNSDGTTKTATLNDGAKGDQGPKGADGRSSYVHFAYAQSDDGTVGFNTSAYKDAAYIGVNYNYEEDDPTTPSSYSWSRLRGDTGPQGPQGEQGIAGATGATGATGPKGADGKTSYIHIKYAPSDNPSDSQITDTPNAYIGVYTDQNPADSTKASAYTWSKWQGKDGARGIQGPQGADGKTTYVHFAYSDSADGKSNFNTNYFSGAFYVGTLTDYNPTDSTDYTAYTWSRLKGDKGDKGDTGATGLQGIQGPKGEQGVPGKDGATGKTSYFHIKYSSIASPTSSSQMSETPSTYIGTYVDFTEADSTDPTKYTWSQFKGSQGAKGDQGIAGRNGADGKTSYLHIAYATSANGSTGFSTSDSAGKTYIGQYTDFVSADSTDYTKYAWTLIKGEKGDKGGTGATGPKALQPTRNWNGTFTTIGQTAGCGTSDFNRTPVVNDTFTNLDGSSNIGTWQVTAVSGTSVTIKLLSYVNSKGADGKGIKSTAIAYQASSSQTTVPSGTWANSVPSLSASSPYLWTRTVITYTDNTTSTSYSVGSTLKGVKVGGRNLLKKVNYKTQYNTPSPINVNSKSGYGFYNASKGRHSILGLVNGLNLETDIEYTVSFVGWLESSDTSATYIVSVDLFPDDLPETEVTFTTSPKRFTWTCKSSSSKMSSCSLRFFTGPSTLDIPSYITDIKLELGNIATDWTPAPEDVDARINSAIVKHEQEYYQSTSDTALSGGSWSTTFPARKDGTFYWVRYKDTHANNAVTYDPSANGKLLTEVNEVWNTVVSNKTAINSSNAQINMIATSVTSVETDLVKKANSDDVKSSMDGISSTIADINKQVAELKVKANSIEASVTDVNNLAQTTQKATASLTTSGLSVDTNQTTKSVVDGTGLTITSKADNSVVAKFTTGESEIQNLKIDGYMKLGAHIVQKMQDAEWDGTIVNGTGWMWNGG